MEVERVASDSENVVLGVELTDVVKPVGEEGAGDAGASTAHLRRKNKKYARTHSKDGDSSAVTPLPKYRSWKNSRRPRNGHGRGLPKKGKFLSEPNRSTGESSRSVPVSIEMHLRNLRVLRSG